METNMQIWKLCLLQFFLLQSFHLTESKPLNATAMKADVGVILDLKTRFGMMYKSCISMAVEDFYSKNSYSTIIVPHFRDSDGEVVAAASAAIDLLKNSQVMAILGPQRSTQADFVIDIGDKVKVPIISPATSPSLSPQESPYFVRSAWRSSSQAKAIAVLVKNFGWREVSIVYEDNNYGSGLVPFLTQDLLEVNSLVSNLTVISPAADNGMILEQLFRLKKMQTRVFIVHVLPSLASHFFRMAKEARMMKEGYVWITTDVLTTLLDSLDSETIEEMQGVIGVKAYYPRSNEAKNFGRRLRKRLRKENPDVERTELNVFGLWAYDSIQALAEGIEKVGLSSQPFKKTADREDLTDLEAIGTSTSGPSLVNLMRNFTSKGLSGDFLIRDGELQPSAFEVMNVVGRGANRVGFWTEKDGFLRKLDGEDSNNPSKNLGGILWPGQTSNAPRGWEVSNHPNKLRVGVPIKSRTKELTNVEFDEEGRFLTSGFCIDVFEEVIASMPYHVEIKYIPFDNSQGKNSTDHHYDDLIEELFFKRFDAVVADLTMSANRSNYVDFTIPYIDSGASTVVPIEDSENAWIFMKPLTAGLWLTIGAFFLITGFVVWVIEHPVNDEFRGPPLEQVGIIFWFIFSTLVFAHKEKVKSNLSRFVVLVWLFTVLVLTASYTASLTSMLTVQQLEPTDIRDLTGKGEYVGYKEGHFVRGFLDSIKSDSTKFRTYTSFEEYDEAFTLGSGKGGVGAVVDNLPSIRLFLSKYCHKYTMIGPTYRKSGFGFAFQKGSPLVPDVSRAILRLKENGKMEEISTNWFGEEGCGSRNGTDVESRSLNLDNFKGLFMFSGLFSLSALAIYLFVFFYKNRHVLLSGDSMKRKLSDLAGAFDRNGDDKFPSSSSSPSKESITISRDEEGTSSPYEGFATIELVVTRE